MTLYPNEIRVITPTKEYTYEPRITEPEQPPMEYIPGTGWLLERKRKEEKKTEE